MLRLIIFIRNNFNIILTVVFFVIAASIIIYILPFEKKFRYEYQKGTYWEHEDLQAPFNFPIYKTKKEFLKEQDSVLSSFKPYFKYDQELSRKRINEFQNDFSSGWKEYSVKNLGIKSEKEYLNNKQYKSYRELGTFYNQLIATWLSEVYMAGIIDLTPVEKDGKSEVAEIYIITGNIADLKELSELYSPRTAFEYVSNKLNEYIRQHKSPLLSKYSAYFNNFNLNYYISFNVTYEEKKSEQIKNQLLHSISRAKGMVQKGQGIISKGEYISGDKFQILESLRMEYEKNIGNFARKLVNIGKAILVIVSLLLIFLFLRSFRKEILFNTIKTSFILLTVVLMVIAGSLTLRYDLISIYIMPFTIVPIILRTFFDSRLALFVHVVTVLLVGFFVPNSYLFVFLNILAGMVAIISLTSIYRRSKLIVTSLLIVITFSITYFGAAIVQEGNLHTIEWKYFAWFALNGILILIAFPLIYVFEKIFGFLSDTSLMELSDTNQTLLRMLAEIAPGTFQHSLQVANLAEDAVFKIGGNPLLARTGALYHDIGKMDEPFYFIENQSQGVNPHDNLEFEQSAEKIIKHVTNGVEIARKNNLPEPIIDFIRTHHGTTTVQFFYKSFLKKYPTKEVDIKKFSYPGPKPFSREMAVLMMADSVEAASRSLKEITDNTIDNLVEDIINSQMKEEQFNDANITFRDITTVKEVFKTRLRNIYHVRIPYPA
jgi:putative nucleotidyltransferase with HDIG domain